MLARSAQLDLLAAVRHNRPTELVPFPNSEPHIPLLTLRKHKCLSVYPILSKRLHKKIKSWTRQVLSKCDLPSARHRVVPPFVIEMSLVGT